MTSRQPSDAEVIRLQDVLGAHGCWPSATEVRTILEEFDAASTEAIEPEAIHLWFSLTYANYLALPRTLLQSMPDEWQARFVASLRELRAAFAHIEKPDGYIVKAAYFKEAGSLTDSERLLAGVSVIERDPEDDLADEAAEDFDPHDLEERYCDESGHELESWHDVAVPTVDPIPHYNRGRTRIEPRLS